MIASSGPRPLPLQRTQAQAAVQDRPGTLTARAAVQTIRDVLDKDVRFHLTDVKVRGAVVIVDIPVTYEGKSEHYNYRVSRGGYLMPGHPTSFPVAFKAPPDQVKVVGITMGSGTALEGSANGGTLDDVKIRS